MSKPLYKQPLFWVFAPVTLVVVMVLDMAQLGVGAVWLKTRVDAVKPADQAPPNQLTRLVSGVRPVYKAKPGEWQVPQPDPSVLDSAPPQVSIVPTKFGPGAEVHGGWGMKRETKAIGIAMSPRYIVQSAYNWKSSQRMVFPDQMPQSQYDFIANLPTGALEGLQQELKKTLGLVAEKETRPMDVIVLRLDHADAPGLKKYSPNSGPVQQPEPGVVHLRAPVETIMNFLEASIGQPVVDQTGLTGTFDITVSEFRRNRGSSGGLEQTKKIFLEQLGLQLIATNVPTEVLVVKKMNP